MQQTMKSRDNTEAEIMAPQFNAADKQELTLAQSAFTF